MPDGAATWERPEIRVMEREWLDLQSQLKDQSVPRQFLDGWLAERGRAFAIETGQIEGLYTLRRGVAEQLIAEGLEGVLGAHTYENVHTGTLQGLLRDQEDAYNLLFGDVIDGQGITQHKIKSWHQLLTRHQKTITGLMPNPRFDRLDRVQVEFKEKGVWKSISNNPRRPDGLIHEYCPPEQVQAEMDTFVEMHREVVSRGYAVEVEAAWAHHRFVTTHPFRDGNGRVSRMLMAWSYVRRGLLPPVVLSSVRDYYIDALEATDRGDLRAFCNFLGNLTLNPLQQAIRLAHGALAGDLDRPNGNGGRTTGEGYFPPPDPEVEPFPVSKRKGPAE